jgi:hypothetical protein
MKNTIFLALAAILFSVSVNAQSTVDSIAAKYKLLPMPEALTIEKTFPVLGTYQLTAADGTTSNVTVTLDSVSKGAIWIAGLPQGTVKAYLKKSPATYRIVSQKSDAGKQVSEGTLIFDPETRVLNIALGAPFNNENPSAIFPVAVAADATASADATANAGESTVKAKTKNGSSKTKSKVTFYTATKVEQNATTTIQ